MSLPQPILETTRLILRPFRPDDAADIQRLAGDVRIADTTLNVPHPYPDGAAEAWIADCALALVEGRRINYAVTSRANGALLGSASLNEIALAHRRAGLGYWIGVPHWNNGYASEAVAALLPLAHAVLGVSRVVAHCLARNPASARVMEKNGLSREGVLRGHVWCGGRFEDVWCYGRNLPLRADLGAPSHR